MNARRITVNRAAADAIAGARLEIEKAKAHDRRTARWLAIGVEAAVRSGTPMTQLAEILGVRRQRLHEQRQALLGDPAFTPLLLLVELACNGHLTADALASKLGVAVEIVQGELVRLLRSQLVQAAAAGYEKGSEVTYYGITSDGELEIQASLHGRLGSDGREPSWTVYYPIDPSEEARLHEVAVEMLGHDWFAILAPGTVRGQNLPELAFSVPAVDQREARVRGEERFRELRERAKLPAQHFPPAEVLEADGYHAVFGPVS
jgi:hypothetical protein